MSSVALQIYPYQRRWIEDPSRFKIGMFARQTGKTFTTCLEIVDSVMAAEASGLRDNWVILSRGERQAAEAINEGVKLHAKAYGLALSSLDYQYEDKFRALEVETPFGSKITALPANPATARGFSRNVFLDEFAFHDNSREIWKALFPVVSKPGLRLRITSTPNGKGNKFYELMTSGDPIWSRHTTDIYQAVADGLPRDPEELRRALNDEDAWEQEYLLHWLDEASAWLSYELIAACEDSGAGLGGRPQGTPVYVGIDLAVARDLWVAVVLERVGDVLWVRELDARRRPTYAEREAIVAGIFSRYNVARLCIDQTGMGEDVTQRYQDDYGEHRVEGVRFTLPNKLILANAIKEVFEDRRVRIPVDQHLRDDLHKVKKIVTPTGSQRFDSDSDAGGHADRFWALSLAIYAASNPLPPPDWRPAESPASDLPDNFWDDFGGGGAW